MNADAMAMARARLALRQAIRGHLSDRNVSLIDFGYPEHAGQIARDELAIRFHVKKKLSNIELQVATEIGYTRPIPESIGGFPTDVPEGEYHPYMWPWGGTWWKPRPLNPHQTRIDPLRGGVSISDEFHNAAGTLGGKVIDRTTGAEMILSNWHVLVTDWGARAGQQIYQPGRLDGGTPANAVATLTRDAMSVNLDAAVATLNGTRRLINDQLELGPVAGVGRATLGMKLVKTGRTSGVTSAFVTAIEGVAKITYGSLERIIRQVITLEPHLGIEQVSAPGDSGSFWLEPQTMRVVGLHFAGSNWPMRGLAIDMPSVLDALNVDVATDQPSTAARSPLHPQFVAGFSAPPASALSVEQRVAQVREEQVRP